MTLRECLKFNLGDPDIQLQMFKKSDHGRKLKSKHNLKKTSEHIVLLVVPQRVLSRFINFRLNAYATQERKITRKKL